MQPHSGLVAQLDRVLDYESRGRGFESSPVHHNKPPLRGRLFAIYLKNKVFCRLVERDGNGRCQFCSTFCRPIVIEGLSFQTHALETGCVFAPLNILQLVRVVERQMTLIFTS